MASARRKVNVLMPRESCPLRALSSALFLASPSLALLVLLSLPHLSRRSSSLLERSHRHAEEE